MALRLRGRAERAAGLVMSRLLSVLGPRILVIFFDCYLNSSIRNGYCQRFIEHIFKIF